MNQYLYHSPSPERERRLERNIAIFYGMNITLSLAFVTGNWIFFWLRVMTMGQVGVVDALAFAFGTLAEIPTGALGDLLGKRRTIIAAMICGMLGWTIMGAADSLLVLIIGFLFTQTGWAFYSGAGTALAYDSLKELGEEQRFERIISRTTSIEWIVNVAATAFGGVLYVLDFRLPHFAWGLAYIGAVIASLSLVEPQVAEQSHFSLRAYWQQLGAGFRELRQRRLRYYMPLFFITLGVNFIIVAGLIQPVLAISFGYDASGQASLFALLSLIAALGAFLVPFVRRWLSDMGYVALIGIILAFGLSLTALPLGMLAGALVLLGIRFVTAMTNPLMYIVVNREIGSQARATTLSTMTMLMKIPYVFTAMLAGGLAENGSFPVFMLALAGLTISVVGVTWLAWGRRWRDARYHPEETPVSVPTP